MALVRGVVAGILATSCQPHRGGVGIQADTASSLLFRPVSAIPPGPCLLPYHPLLQSSPFAVEMYFNEKTLVKVCESGAYRGRRPISGGGVGGGRLRCTVWDVLPRNVVE
jgi:hypothetical protein